MGFMNSRIKNFDGQILSIGLGSQSDNSSRPLAIPAGTRDWLEIISTKCKPNTHNIAVRGSSTLKDLDAIGMAGNAVVTGCPSNFLSDNPRLGESIASKLPHIFERVCVASGHYKWDYLKSIEQDLLKLASETGGFYVMQSPSEMIALGLNKLHDLDASAQEEIRHFCYPESSSDEFDKLVKRIFKVYLNVSDWMLDMSKHSLVIGARIHGVMAGIQAGIPGLCIAHDPRTIELCQEMNIPYLTREQVASGLDKSKVAHALDIDWSAYDRRRALLLERYYSFLASNGVTPSRRLVRLKAQLCGQQMPS
ncbi:polysaccharide pyruvyl transferase family protein [Synechococcus sp. CS-1332]|nr:polysaccharide pyruvyl transferase family protein [Synechococcus sp. CS-1332]